MKFLLETSALTNVASSFAGISADVEVSSSAAKAWDTANEDGFDFDGAKNAIANNISACANKINSTKDLLNLVVESHDQLQNSMKFDSDNPNTALSDKESDEKNNSAGNENSSQQEANQVYPTTSGGSTGGSYRSSSGSSSSRGFSTQQPSYKPFKEVAPAAISSTATNAVKKQTKTAAGIVAGATAGVAAGAAGAVASGIAKTVKEPVKIKEISYAAPKYDKLSTESKNLIDNEVTYDDNGYSKIDDKYLIAASPDVGKVGDLVRFTTNKGESIECVVGVNTVSKNNEKMFFLVNENKNDVIPHEYSEKLVLEDTKVENLGNYKTSIVDTNELGDGSDG